MQRQQLFYDAIQLGDQQLAQQQGVTFTDKTMPQLFHKAKHNLANGERTINDMALPE